MRDMFHLKCPLVGLSQEMEVSKMGVTLTLNTMPRRLLLTTIVTPPCWTTAMTGASEHYRGGTQKLVYQLNNIKMMASSSHSYYIKSVVVIV